MAGALGTVIGLDREYRAKEAGYHENAGGRAQKFLKLTERHAAFTELTPAILNEFISRIEVHERDQKRGARDTMSIQ